MNLLKLFEVEYFIRRLQEKTMVATLNQAATVCFANDDIDWMKQQPLWDATHKLCSTLDTQAELDGVFYHNKYHFQDAVLAAAILGLREPNLTRLERLELLAIMTAHDIYHDGTVNTEEKSLEKISANAFLPYMVASNVPTSQQEKVTAVILSTDPKLYKSNSERYQHAVRSGSTSADVLVGLAHDADLLGSLLPATGMQNTHNLVQEWLAHGNENASSIGSFSGRAKFLKHVKPISRAARTLGLEHLCDAQLAAIDSLGTSISADSTAQGAAVLDALPSDEAQTLFLQLTENTAINCGSPSLDT